MRHHSFGIVVCCLLAQAAPALAASAETWVAANGTPGACTLTDPCLTFAQALAQTTNGGTINVLTPGNYGPVTINKGVSIIADAVEAVINASPGAAAIIVQAGSNAVSLRGLTIDVAGKIGISFVSGASLQVDKTTIRRTTNGIKFAPAAGVRELYVANSTIGDTTSDGILVAPTGSGAARVVLDRVQVENARTVGMNFEGNGTTGAIKGTVRESTSSGAGYSGLIASEAGSGTTTLMVDRSTFANNVANGVIATGSGAKIRIGDSTATGNGTGLKAAATGVIESYESNKVNGNTADTSGTITPIAYR